MKLINKIKHKYCFFIGVVMLSLSLIGGFCVSAYASGLSFASAVVSARPAVVNIYTKRNLSVEQKKLLDSPMLRYYFGNKMPKKLPEQNSLGSGVVVDSSGYVLTNYHVVRGASEIQLAFVDGKRISATLVGSDPETDLAVLKINNNKLNYKTWRAIKLGSSSNLRVGDVVLAIGNPFGLGQTVTQGIVSATGRDSLGINQFENFIQTDAAINPGNSGGALITSDGRLIGINSAIFSRSGGNQGIGFAIPIDLAKKVMNEIIKHGRVSRGWLGISIVMMTPEIAQKMNVNYSQGIGVLAVAKGSPASHAGLREGDIIFSVGGKDAKNPRSFMHSVAGLSPGNSLNLGYYRRSERHNVYVKVGQRPARPQQELRLSQQPHGDQAPGRGPGYGPGSGPGYGSNRWPGMDNNRGQHRGREFKWPG